MNKEAMKAEQSQMKEYFERSTRVLAEEDSKFAPKPEMFTAAQVVAHAAQTVEWFFEGAFAQGGFNTDFEGLDKQVRKTTSLKAARSWMERACTAADKAIAAHTEAEWAQALPEGPIMGGLPRFAIFKALTDHTAHHRGALAVYARLLGKVPLMPYMET